MNPPGPPPAVDPEPRRPSPSLRRELLAIAVLYVVLSILPLLVGMAFS